MKTRTGLECDGRHDYNGKRGEGRWEIMRLKDRRYTVCAHRVGETGYCGQIIDVTDLPAVVICCGLDVNHR